MSVIDEFGLVKPNKLLVVIVPVSEVALVFRVKYRKVFRLEYPGLPIKKGETLALYGGGEIIVPADGVMPAMSFTFRSRTFPYPGAFDETDMFYIPKEWSDTIFHVHHHIKPAWIRVEIQIPPDNLQIAFQRDKISGGVDMPFGFKRGHIEVVHLPDVKIGFRFGNDTSVTVLTGDLMIIGEYNVELVLDPEVVFDAIVGKAPAYVYTYPTYKTGEYVLSKIKEVYGFEGFPIYPEYKKSEAINKYKEIISKIKR